MTTTQQNQIVKAKSTPQLPAALLEELNAEALAIKERLNAPTGDYITATRNKTFKMPGADNEAPSLRCIVIDWVSMNQWYPGRYDPNNIKPPACVALGPKPLEMKPFDGSPDKQHADCGTCPKNQWAKDGSGKECKNQFLLALLPVDDQEKGPIMLLKVSPTGLKWFEKYVRTVTSSGIPVPHPVSVITIISFDEKADYPSLRFATDGPNLDVGVGAARRKEAHERLMVAPSFAPK